MDKCKLIPLDKIFKSLGDPIRMGVIKQLIMSETGEMSCGSFDYCVNKATFSHHIKILLEAHILCERTEGVKKYLFLNPSIKKLYPGLVETIRITIPD
ncbi:ArsR/SmtB family transcription factor [Bacteriovorax sp. BSW11_IV]|uniref:ArsR/SmtB family transcription factor n=1 Tax=Bacteriovorax sp. BSW11_IV TaxID=1353529 RepID=UPI0009DC2691|nr:helix-turn-helix domain-containing protein [Bacteriovorax sp. BSW11_IV]